MELNSYLVDSNVVIDYLGRKLSSEGMEFMNSVIDAIPIVSVITKMEVLGFNTSDAHTTLLRNFMGDAYLLELTEEIIEMTISIRRSHKIKLPDAIIAATALTGNFTLLTRNTADFAKIDGLDYFDPHTI